ncbi:uncharacterized protein cusr [Brachionichthys hirsutus]|uniref:uncharacterized protein cusr n=1 Tax=Brachionichthys hirsutus TaxID=412623 RepID=UPI003604D344
MNSNFLIVRMGTRNYCARIYIVQEKQVSAVLNMRGIRGYISFRQTSPFEVTELRVNLNNLRERVGTYHVHKFPILSISSPPSSVCSLDNVGGHWNPFGLNTSAPSYPNGPGSTHDLYELGDLSTKHMSLAGLNSTNVMFMDFNLPLFGNNSIVGRSVVIHRSTDGSRYACAGISYPGEVVVGRATFRSVIIGNMYFTQLLSNRLSDVSIFIDLAYANATMASTANHNYHVHVYPISSERDDDPNRCSTTGPHWNPHNVNTSDSSYAMYCGPSIPIACEVGDLSNKLGAINFSPNVGSVEAKYFFTDVTSCVPGIIGRSIVVHEADRGPIRIACANVTRVRVARASLGSWLGPGNATGQIHFSEAVPQGPTTINVSLMNLNTLFSGYHVHVLPLIPGSADPCSSANILGHYNPFNFNISLSPPPGEGTADQYELGDLSGKHGTLAGLNDSISKLMDPALPLRGPYSSIGRSVVLHFTNGSRLQCANITRDTAADLHLTIAKATFSGMANGTLTLSQSIYSDDSSSDTSILTDVPQITGQNPDMVSVFILTGNGSVCSNLSVTFNPFNMTSMNPSCSLERQLGCVVGEISARHNISLSQRQVLTDDIIQLTGDKTVVGRAVMLMNATGAVACAEISPVSPSANQTFVFTSNFSRYEFRRRVSDALMVVIPRVTILAGFPMTTAQGSCQTVRYMVSGDVSAALLASVRTSPLMGRFIETSTCSSTGAGNGGVAGAQQASGPLLLGLMFALSFLLPLTG